MERPPNSGSVIIGVNNYEDVILARQKVRELMAEMKFTLLDQTRVVTAVSELTRNMIVHAGKGQMTIVRYDNEGNRTGFKCIFEDHGPGISNLDLAMKEGNSAANSLGLGLGGAKKLCRNFRIQSTSGKGTKIEIVEWK